MEPAERLAAFLAGELSADEHQAVEAALARDAALRAELAAMRRADEALAGEAPTALPEGARDRLMDALAATFDAELGTSATGAVTGGTDELATRRRAAATRRSWLVGVGGVAAAIAAIAVVGPTLGELGGSDDTVETMASPESEGEAAFDQDDAAGSLFAAPVGPTLLGGERALDEDGAADLLAAGELEAIVDQGLALDEAAALGGSWAQAFGAGTPYSAEGFAELDGEAFAADAAAETAADDGDEEAPATESDDADLQASTRGRLGHRELAGADLQILGDVSEDDREDVGRCLDTLLQDGGVIVPVLAVLVTFEGEPAVAFALASVAPDDTVTRREVWVLARESCEVRYLRAG